MTASAPQLLQNSPHSTYGDPGKEGLFAFRLKVPQGYHVAPHTHPKPEIVTVLSGTARLGMGTTPDHDKAQVLPAGSFFALHPVRSTTSSPTKRRLFSSTAPVRGASTTSIPRTTRVRRRSSGTNAGGLCGGVGCDDLSRAPS